MSGIEIDTCFLEITPDVKAKHTEPHEGGHKEKVTGET